MILKCNKSGFTLVELLVAMAISTIVLTLMYQVYRGQLRTHTTQQELVEMQQNMRAVLYLMERDIRMAGYAPEGGVIDPVFTKAETRDIEFAMDIRGDGTLDPSNGETNDPGEIVRYYVKDGNLVRDANLLDEFGVPIGEQILLESTEISSIEFIYKDIDGLAPGSPADIRSVEIILNASIGPTPMVDRHQMQLTSEVKIRNLGISP